MNDSAYTRRRRVVLCEKLHSPAIGCPKSLARDRQGRLYAGSLDGKVYCVHNDDTQAIEVVATFPNGRPLGMRITPAENVLYFIEANSGLYAYHLERKDLKHLLGNLTIIGQLLSNGDINNCTFSPFLIEDLGESRFLDGKPSKFFDDLAVAQESDGRTVIYITDVSRKFALDMWCYTYLEPDSSGRILRYDVGSGTTTVVLENLCFPNGIEITDNNESLLICELAKRRILRHHLKGAKAGLTTVLIDNLPGEPENVRRAKDGDKETYWIGLALTRDYRDELSFLDNYATDPNLRKLILRSCYIFGKLFSILVSTRKDTFLAFLLGSFLQYLGNFFANENWKSKGLNLKTGLALILSDFMTKPGMALEVDLEGNVLLSLQVKDDVSVISEIHEIESDNVDTRVLYTGSSGGPMGKIILKS